MIYMVKFEEEKRLRPCRSPENYSGGQNWNILYQMMNLSISISFDVPHQIIETNGLNMNRQRHGIYHFNP